MHSRTVKKLRVHYNSDWSGEVIVHVAGKEPLIVDAWEFQSMCLLVARDLLEERMEELAADAS